MDYIHPEKECRICLESHRTLICVCGCKGSAKFVHYQCIQKWRNTFPKNHNKYVICDLCHCPYNIVEPYWTKKKILLWYNATCFSIITVVVPVCAIADTLVCLKYQFSGNIFYKRVQPCYFKQLFWILLSSFFGLIHFCMLQQNRCYAFSAWVCFAAIALVTTLLDATGIFICLFFVVSILFPSCTCCIAPQDVVCCC